jgi:hypothetical protein
VSLAQALREDEIERVAERLLRADAEDALRRGIP